MSFLFFDIGIAFIFLSLFLNAMVICICCLSIRKPKSWIDTNVNILQRLNYNTVLNVKNEISIKTNIFFELTLETASIEVLQIGYSQNVLIKWHFKFHSCQNNDFSMICMYLYNMFSEWIQNYQNIARIYMKYRGWLSWVDISEL